MCRYTKYVSFFHAIPTCSDLIQAEVLDLLFLSDMYVFGVEILWLKYSYIHERSLYVYRGEMDSADIVGAYLLQSHRSSTDQAIIHGYKWI